MIDPAFAEMVKRTKVADLKREFPNEATSHASMLTRERNGRAQVNASLRSFRNFLIAIGPQPAPKYTVDRIDPYDPEYAAGKIRWASKREQSNNRKNTTLLRGRDDSVFSLSDWAKRTNQNPNTLRQRKKRGWTDIEIIEGRKFDKHVRPPTSEAKGELWPVGARISDWEQHYRDWLKAREKPLAEDTRSVFYAWVELGAISCFIAKLAVIFPGTFGPEASPDDDDPDVDVHPLYIEYNQRRIRLEPVLNGLSVSERANLNLLRRRRPADPRQAVESERSERRKYR